MKKHAQIGIFFVFMGVYHILGDSTSEIWTKFFWTGLNAYLCLLVIQLVNNGKTSSVDILAGFGMCFYLFLDTIFYYIVPSGELFQYIDLFTPKLILSVVGGAIYILIKKLSNG